MKQKLFTLFLGLAVSAGILHAEIHSGSCGRYLAWSLNTEDSTLTITGTGAMYNWDSDYRAPWPSSYIKSVSLPDGLTSIGNGAFSGCRSLTSVTIPNSVTNIGERAFSSCTGLTSVIIGNSVANIGDRAFYSCTGLTSVTIPNSVTSIGYNVFTGCSNLTKVTLNSNAIVSIENPSSWSDTTMKRFFGVQVEEYVLGESVTCIGDYAFCECTNLTSITLPNTVTRIGHHAFDLCTSLTSITIPDSVTIIGIESFYGCKGLASISIGKSVTNIYDGAFYNCSSLTKVTLNSNTIVSKTYTSSPSSIKDIFGVQVEEYVLGESVTNIGKSAFSNCTGLTSVIIGKNVTSIGAGAFSSCTGLTAVAIPNSVTSIGGSAFEKCTGLTSVTIPNSVANIGDRAFYNCTGLTSVTIPNSVTNIGKSAFSSCTGLTSVIIGENVTEIGEAAFYNCTGLNSITIPNSVTSIGFESFCGCTGLTSVIIGENVTEIGEAAFYNCTGLNSITIPNSVTSIGFNAFTGCSSLTSVTIPNNVTSIGGAVFSSCSGLVSIVVEDGNATYDSRENCNAIIETATNTLINGCQNTIIPNSVTSIEYSAFRDCTGLNSITIPNSVTSIGTGAFYGCTGLTSVTIGENVTSIENFAFEKCWAIKSITCKAEIPPTCENYTFYNVTRSIPLYVPKGSVAAYKAADGWSTFTNILAISEVFTITFVNWDGATLQSTQIEKGETPQYTGATPTRPEDDEYTYTFAGWTPEVVAVTSDATYTATYASTSRKYTIIFLDENGSVLSSEQWCYGVTPTCDEPSKPATAQFTYTFAGWTPEVVAVTGDATYTATYSSTLRQYTITFKNDDGKTIESKKWDYGATPTCDEPSKPATAQYTYTFAGWSPEVVAVTEDATYTATYSSVVNKYMITFKDEDGTILCEDEWEYGSIPSCNEPTKEDDTYYKYIFAGWNPEVVEVIGEVTYTATYNKEPKEDHGQAEDITNAKVEATPTEDGSVIISWPEVNGATTYTIQLFKNGELICTLVFNENGQLLAINLSAPARDGHERNVTAATQAGKGWTYTINGLEANATYTYSVTAKNDNGSTLFEQSVEFTTGSLQAIDDVDASSQPVKFLRDGQILIQKGDKTFDLRGQEVK